jgi:hypothetical protein
MAMLLMAPGASAQPPTTNDPRFGLSPGLNDAGVAAKGMNLMAHLNKGPLFTPPSGNPGDF